MKTKLLTLLCCALTLLSASAQNTTKLRVTDPQRAQQLIARGATLIADYGSFQILEAPATVGKAAVGQTEVTSVDEMNQIQLNAAQLDTTTPAVKALRAPLAAFSGKRLHLVQFAGPIKPEWRDELEKRGARIVTHIPNNAYLVYGDSTALAKVQAWARTCSGREHTRTLTKSIRAPRTPMPKVCIATSAPKRSPFNSLKMTRRMSPPSR